ncbi:alpha/beta hydrolase [Fischerella thermalis]
MLTILCFVVGHWFFPITNYQLPITNYQPRRQYKYSSEHDMKFISWRTKK